MIQIFACHARNIIRNMITYWSPKNALTKRPVTFWTKHLIFKWEISAISYHLDASKWAGNQPTETTCNSVKRFMLEKSEPCFNSWVQMDSDNPAKTAVYHSETKYLWTRYTDRKRSRKTRNCLSWNTPTNKSS